MQVLSMLKEVHSKSFTTNYANSRRGDSRVYKHHKKERSCAMKMISLEPVPLNVHEQAVSTMKMQTEEFKASTP